MLSVVIPARNEESAIVDTVKVIAEALTKASIEHEIIVVDDGSTDRTGELAKESGARVIRHPSSGGYGRLLKDGILAARYDLIGITDADGTYPNERLPELYRLVAETGFDMAVGARTGKEYRGTFLKMPARAVFLWLSQYASGQKIDDINSGLRVFRKEIVVQYMDNISNGFSFTTTITLASLLNGRFVKYIPIEYFKRRGHSHVRYWRDTLRSLQIIIESILYFNPLKLYLLLVNALLLVALAGGAGIIFAPEGRLLTFCAYLSGTAFAAAVIVGAIGLQADLSRMLRQRKD